jgi:hypothetical protein
MSRIGTRERLCIFFAVNPDEELNTRDILIKYELQSINRVRETVRSMERAKLLERRPAKMANQPNSYRAGPELLREIRRLGG